MSALADGRNPVKPITKKAAPTRGKDAARIVTNSSYQIQPKGQGAIHRIAMKDTNKMESSVLGSLMENPERFFPEAQKLELTADHFGSKPLADTWRLLSERLSNGKSIDLELLLSQESERVAAIGGHAQLGLINADYCPTDSLFAQYCSEIKAESLRRDAREKIKALEQDLEAGGNPADKFQELSVTLEGLEGVTGGKPSLIEKAYTMNFKLDDPPPADEACLYLGKEHAIAARGNITVIQGKQKAGKSAVVSSILGATIRGNYAAQGDVFEFNWLGKSDGAIIHFDTEQSPEDWHNLVARSLNRSGLTGQPDRLVSVPAVTFTIGERLTVLEGVLERERDKKGSIDAVLLDGVADLCKSPNDEAESNDLVARIHGLSHEFNCPFFAVLHENPSTDTGKTRGHLGSQLGRKAFANLRVDKDPETQVSTIYGTDMRKRDLPKNQGFCFGWDDTLMMHAFQGRHAGLAMARKEREQIEKAREYWEPIYEKAAESGTNGLVPPLSVQDAIQLDWDISGTEKKVSRETMRKRIQRHRELGVLRKEEGNTYSLNPRGTSGT